MNNITNITENVKKSMNTAEKLLHNLYFMEKAEEIRKLYEDTFKNQQKFMEQNVYRIGRSKRSSFIWNASHTMQLLKSSFSSKDRNMGAGEFVNELRQDQNKDSIYNKIIQLKKNFWQNVTNTSSKVKKEYGPSAIFLEEQGRKMLDAKYATIQAELALTNDGMGEVIAELFDIAKVEPVVAEPVSEAGPRPRQSSETSKTNDGNKQRTFGNMVKKKAAKTRKAARGAAKAVENAVKNATNFTRTKRPRSTTKTSASSKNGSPKRQRVPLPSRSSPRSVTMEEEYVVPI